MILSKAQAAQKPVIVLLVKDGAVKQALHTMIGAAVEKEGRRLFFNDPEAREKLKQSVLDSVREFDNFAAAAEYLGSTRYQKNENVYLLAFEDQALDIPLQGKKVLDTAVEKGFTHSGWIPGNALWVTDRPVTLADIGNHIVPVASPQQVMEAGSSAETFNQPDQQYGASGTWHVKNPIRQGIKDICNHLYWQMSPSAEQRRA
ncbi:MAG: hypothetical protein KGJ06_07365 [Pseudomonadota bacterium]|nr:hypothetical protein [Pseudomonadota bacterium]